MWSKNRFGLLIGKLIISIGCMICFGANSSMIFSNYIKKSTTIASYSEKRKEGIEAPALTFCDPNLIPESQDTKSIKESLGVLHLGESNTTLNYELIPLHTARRGSCFVLHLKHKVRWNLNRLHNWCWAKFSLMFRSRCHNTWDLTYLARDPWSCSSQTNIMSNFWFWTGFPSAHFPSQLICTQAIGPLRCTSLKLLIPISQTRNVHRLVQKVSVRKSCKLLSSKYSHLLKETIFLFPQHSDFVNCFLTRIKDAVISHGPNCTTPFLIDLIGSTHDVQCDEQDGKEMWDITSQSMDETYRGEFCLRMDCLNE